MSKLLLFDIDGTLISGRGVPKQVFLDVMRRRYPEFRNGESLQFAGLTDPLIIRKLLGMNDFHAEPNDGVIAEILDDCMKELAVKMNPSNPPRVLPGVRELLNYCRSRTDAYAGLVTGNMALGAKIKLQAADLYQYFAVGAFGSDHWNRNELPPIALKRAQVYFSNSFDAANSWIIGDSIYDIRCAKANGMKCLAVASSVTPATELLAENPDVLLNDLSDTGIVAEYLGI